MGPEQAAATSDPGETLDALLKEIDVFEAADGVQSDEALVPPEPVADTDELFERVSDETLEKAWEEVAPEKATPEKATPEKAAPDTHADSLLEVRLDSPSIEDLPGAQDEPLETPAMAEVPQVAPADPVSAPADDRFVRLFDDPVEALTVETSTADARTVEQPQTEPVPIPNDSSIDATAFAAEPPVSAAPVAARSRRKRGGRRPPPTPVAEAKVTETVVTPPEPVILAPPPTVPEPQAAQSRKGFRWMLLLPVGVLLIAAQVAIYFFPAWSADPEMRWIPEQVCAVGGCELEPLKALDQLLITDVVIRAHPEDPKLRLVNVLLVNTASFAQAFPDVEIAFRAPTNDLVAWKRVPASDYLAASLKNRPVIPEKTPVRIEFSIEDPGTQSYGYEISLK